MRLWGRKVQAESRAISVEDEMLRAAVGHLHASVRLMRDCLPTDSGIALDHAERTIRIWREYRAGARHLVAVPREGKK